MTTGSSSKQPEVCHSTFLSYLNAHRNQLFNLIYCMVHNLSDAEDVFQDTCISLWADFDQFEPGTNFAAWASTFARHRALVLLRSKRRERTYFSNALMEQLAESQFEPPEIQDRRLEALAHCRQMLSESDHALLVACYAGEQKIHELARKINRPPQSVYGSLSRIRRALQSCIERRIAGDGLGS